MHLTPHELDKLTLHQAGVLAQKRLARGVRLNHPEAVALIATQILEFIRDGRSVAELMNLGRQLLGRADVMDGVAELVHEVQIEGTFPDGTKLVTVHNPIVAEHGNLDLALYGSFLPVPEPDAARATASGSARRAVPGEVTCAPGEIVANDGRDVAQLAVTNRGDRPIQVGSHYHFVETNRALDFDRQRGLRHAARHSRRHRRPLRTRRNQNRLARRHCRPSRHSRRQQLRARVRTSALAPRPSDPQTRQALRDRTMSHSHQSKPLRRHLRPDNRRSRFVSATRISPPRSSGITRCTATSASSAAARCCATAWARPPASARTTRSTASSPTRSSWTGPASTRPTSASSAAASPASARRAIRT